MNFNSIYIEVTKALKNIPIHVVLFFCLAEYKNFLHFTPVNLLEHLSIIEKMCKIYTVLPKNNSHQFIYNCINLQICYNNHITLTLIILYLVVCSLFTYLEDEEKE